MTEEDILKIMVNNSSLWVKKGDTDDEDVATLYVGDFVRELLKAINDNYCPHNSIKNPKNNLIEFAKYAQKRQWEDGNKDLHEFVGDFLKD